MTRSTLHTAILGVLVLAISACGGDTAPQEDASPQAVTELSVTGTDALAFEPDEFTVPAGQQVTLEFAASPSAEHDFVITDAADHGSVGDVGHGAHADEDHAETSGDLHVAHADAGQTVTATFTIDVPGIYEVHCSVPGHRESGMVATLTVVGD